MNNERRLLTRIEERLKEAESRLEVRAVTRVGNKRCVLGRLIIG